jgi:Mg/Co/Ni transporter MgtE
MKKSKICIEFDLYEKEEGETVDLFSNINSPLPKESVSIVKDDFMYNIAFRDNDGFITIIPVPPHWAEKHYKTQAIEEYDERLLPCIEHLATLFDAKLNDVVQTINTMKANANCASQPDLLDIAKMAAVTPTEKPYLKTSTWRLWITRVPWLMLLMISATFTGLIISANEATLNSGVYGILLTACIPMIMGTGGNAGGQASATIIRGIAVNEICFRDFFRVVWKEIRVSIILGLSLAVVCFGKVLLLDGLLFGVEGVDAMSAFIISISMFVTIVLAKIVGSTLPLIAKKCHLDPAVMASPFITTILDILSLLVYCFLATTFLM